MAIHIAQDADADRVLTESPFALLTGMLLDQQFPMERAFAGPAKIAERLGSFDPASVAAADPEAFAEICSRTPAVHRFPARWRRGSSRWPSRSSRSTTAT